MRDQELIGLWEAYGEVYQELDEVLDTPQKTQSYAAKNAASAVGAFVRGDGKTLTKRFEGAKRGMKKIEKRNDQREEVDIEVVGDIVETAAQYFYEMGLNEEGVEIVIEELGLEEFVDWVYDLSEEYVLTEARAGGVKIEPKLSSGKPVQGKPKPQTLKALRKQKAARTAAEQEASDKKPSGMKASLQRQSAVAAAAKKQPKKPGLLDRVAGAINRGIDRHNAAVNSQGWKKTKEAAGKLGRGLATAAKAAVSEEYILEYLVAEGYADTNKAALAIMANMSEEWRESIVEARGEGPEAAEPGSRLSQQIFRGAKKIRGSKQARQDLAAGSGKGSKAKRRMENM